MFTPKKTTIIILLSLFFQIGITGKYLAQTSTEISEFPTVELKEDLDYLFQKLENIHPDLYHYTSKEVIDSMRNKVMEAMDKPMTKQEFALHITPLVSALGDGHTSLNLPNDERKEYLDNGGGIFPFGVKITDGKVFIIFNYSEENNIARGSEIRSINGVSTGAILENMRQYFSAELDHFRDIRVERNFGRMLWFLYRFEERYTLQLKHETTISTIDIEGIELAEYRQRYALIHSQNIAKPYSYYTLEGTSIGVIDFRSMRDKKEFQKFLDSAFTVIHANNIQHLVIDIRNNGGGNSQLADMLFDYITDKPYKMVEEMDIKISKEMRKNIRERRLKWFLYPIAYPAALFVSQARPYFYGKPGKTVTIIQKKANDPKNEKLKFAGPTYLLTSHYTFSSANMLAAAYKCYGMGTVVGEETGGVLAAFGDLIYFNLPNTQLNASCSYKKFTHPCYTGKVHGVIPDVVIKETMDDILTDRDKALEYIRSIAG